MMVMTGASFLPRAVCWLVDVPQVGRRLSDNPLLQFREVDANARSLVVRARTKSAQSRSYGIYRGTRCFLLCDASKLWWIVVTVRRKRR